MFSIEEEFDASVITIIDNDAKYEDFQIIVSDNVVFFRQWNEIYNRHEVIQISPHMFNELFVSMNHTEGLYLTSPKNVNK